METAKAIFSAVAAFFGWKSKKLDLENTPDMRARAQAETDQELKENAATEVTQGNLDSIRKDLAE